MPRVTYSHISSFTLRTREEKANFIWSAICFKIMTLYTCGFLPRIPALFPALRGFYSQVYDHSLTTRIYMPTKKPIYMRYKQACVYGSQKVVV